MHLNKSYQWAWLHCPRHGHYAVRGEGGKGRGKWQLVLKRRHRDHRGGGGGGLVARVFDELHGWTRTKVKPSFGFSFSQLSPPAADIRSMAWIFFFFFPPPRRPISLPVGGFLLALGRVAEFHRRSFRGDHGRNLVIDEGRDSNSINSSFFSLPLISPSSFFWNLDYFWLNK